MIKTAIFLIGACLVAAAQTAPDAPGVRVDTGSAVILHRTPVMYPESARRQNLQGTVMLSVTLDATGTVTDARVVSGPEGLRKTALESVLQWHFANNGGAGAQRQVSIEYRVPEGGVPTGVTGGVPGGVLGGIVGVRPMTAPNGRQVTEVRVLGLPDQARADLQSRLPVHAGDEITPDLMERVGRVAREFDEHLRISTSSNAAGDTVITITPPNFVAEARVTRPLSSTATKVGGTEMQARLVRQVAPYYPDLAKQARIQGVVKLEAIIARDGSVKQVEVISGHPLLVPATIEAVRQWVYQPTLLNGAPVEVETQIDVNFTLSQ